MDYISIGKIVNTHGLKGEIRLISKFKYKNRVFVKNMPIYIGKEKTKEIINTYRKHKNFDMITLIGYNNINDILKYKGAYTYINKNDLNLSENEYLDEDLIGLKVICNNQIQGTITKIEDYNTNKLIIVNKEGKDFLIPYNSDIIKQINFKEGNIQIEDYLIDLFK